MGATRIRHVHQVSQERTQPVAELLQARVLRSDLFGLWRSDAVMQ